MHARRAYFRRAAAPSKTTGGRFFSALWLTCLVGGLVLLADFAYGMGDGGSEQHHLNQGWKSQAGAVRGAPKTVDPALKRPVDGGDFAIRGPRPDDVAA